MKNKKVPSKGKIVLDSISDALKTHARNGCPFAPKIVLGGEAAHDLCSLTWSEVGDLSGELFQKREAVIIEKGLLGNPVEIDESNFDLSIRIEPR